MYQLAFMNMDPSLTAMLNPMGGAAGLGVAGGDGSAKVQDAQPKKAKREKASLHY